MKKLYIDIYQDQANEWRWRMCRGGRIVADSGEGYAKRSGAVRAVNSLCKVMASQVHAVFFK